MAPGFLFRGHVPDTSYRAANLEHVRKYERDYRAANLEAVRLIDRNRYKRNREALCTRSKNYYKANRETAKLKRRLHHSGLPKEEQLKAEIAWKNFDGHCQCCGSTEHHSRGWHLDHCHILNVFRGFICGHCNAMLGMAQDSIDKLMAGIVYLQIPRSLPNVDRQSSDVCPETVLVTGTEAAVA